MQPPEVSSDEVVRPPATDRPALTDRTTAILLDVLARKVKSATSGFYLTPVMLLSIGSPFLGGLIIEPPFLILYGIPVALFLLVFGQALFAQVRFGRWLPRARRLLAAQPWRPLPARVISSRVVEVGDGEPWRLRTTGMYDAVRQVIARTGRVWLVGPDAKGWVAIRVDGAHAPWPARKRRGRIKAAAPQIADRGGLRTAADDPVSASWARTASWLLRRQLWPYVLIAVVFALLSVALGWVTHRVVPWVIFGLVFVIPCAVLLAVRLRRSRDHRKLPALLRIGPWRRVRAELRPWSTRPTGLADARGTVWLDNGVGLEIALPGANVDLLGTVWETGSVWLAGEPATGKTLAAGFPGYPVLGVAKLS